MYAEVLLSQQIGTDKETLTYQVPSNLQLEIGHLVMVQLRRKEIYGIVLHIHDQQPTFKTLEIKQLIFEKPVLNKQQLELIQWMSDYYFCSLNKLLKLFVSTRVLKNKKLNEKNKLNDEHFFKSSAIKLNNEQVDIISKMETKKENKFLIHGVTGSGKTEVYCRLAEKALKHNHQVLILVPEISLTPQTIEYFEKNLGIKATVIHSKLLDTHRQRSWHKIWSNEAKLIIGSRSAIFAPFQDLKLIIIDEEHESSYKQDVAPRYHIHEVAEKMQEQDPDLKIIYGSATPSIETKEKLESTTVSLTKRTGISTLPNVEIIDLRDEFKKRNYSIFSDSLREAMEEALAKKEQIILFLNRRGSASSIVCRDCGYCQKCENCETPMTHHTKTLSSAILICHHCGKLAKPPSTCPNCRGVNIRFLGIGTQKIEQETLLEFPNAKILRADKDSTSSKDGFQEIYKKFKNGEADILIGTQMIAKGLHLPKVNLVGVILADIGLNIPDYKTTERNFQLMMQITGRAGRNSNRGKVIIQTYNPDNIALICTKKHSYEDFFKYERTQRKILGNPPFGEIAKIIVQNKSADQCLKQSKKIHDLLKELAGNNEEIEINHYPAYLSKLRGKYRHIVFIKDKAKQKVLHNLIAKLPKEYIIDPNIKIDINPLSTT